MSLLVAWALHTYLSLPLPGGPGWATPGVRMALVQKGACEPSFERFDHP